MGWSTLASMLLRFRLLAKTCFSLWRANTVETTPSLGSTQRPAPWQYSWLASWAPYASASASEPSAWGFPGRSYAMTDNETDIRYTYIRGFRAAVSGAIKPDVGATTRGAFREGYIAGLAAIDTAHDDAVSYARQLVQGAAA